MNTLRRTLGLAFSAVVIAGLLLIVTQSLPERAEGAGAVGLSAFFADTQQGDWLGRGAQRYMAHGDGYTMSISVDARGVNVGIQSTTLAHDWWEAYFGAAQGEFLQPGTYEAATKGAPPGPILMVSAAHRGCNTSSGRFTIHQLEMASPTQVQRFAASFEHHCETGFAAAFGEVHYASTGVPLPAIVVSPQEATFGGVGDSSTFIISNLGTTTQHVTAAVHGPNAADFQITSPDCTSLAPGTSCEVKVKFQTSESGELVAYLMVHDETLRGRRSAVLQAERWPFVDLAVVAIPNPAVAGQPISVTAQVDAAAGEVAFRTPTEVLGTAFIDAQGKAATVITLPAGQHWLFAVATGGSFGRSESPPLLVEVSP